MDCSASPLKTPEWGKDAYHIDPFHLKNYSNVIDETEGMMR
jgi:hypothetical protein